MPTTRHAFQRLRHHALAIAAMRAGPFPVSPMLRSGGSIGFALTLFLALGRQEAAIVCAFFVNFLCLADRAERLANRVWVQALGGLLFLGLGALGLLVAGDIPVIMAVVLAVALVAGFVHGTAPGLEALPRFGLCCLVVTAFLPLDRSACLWAGLVGTAISTATVLIDHRLRHGRHDDIVARINAGAGRPGPRFSVIYGVAAACGLMIGVLWGGMRPYWVTITTLLVMQPDRRANTVRVAQRFLGTIAGVLLAFAAVRAMPPAARAQGLLAMAYALPFLWPLAFERNYGLGTAVLSLWVLMLIDTGLPSADLVGALFRARLSDTAIGCAIALAGSFAFFEVRRELSESATIPGDRRAS